MLADVPILLNVWKDQILAVSVMEEWVDNRCGAQMGFWYSITTGSSIPTTYYQVQHAITLLATLESMKRINLNHTVRCMTVE